MTLRYDKITKFLITLAAGIAIGWIGAYGMGMPENSKPVGILASATKKILPVKVYQQETECSCGGAVVKSLLDYYGLLKGRGEVDLSGALGTGCEPPNRGTHPDRMVKFLEDEGLKVESGESGSLDLIYHYIDQGVPVVVLDSTWGAHWRMIIGYDFHGDRSKWEHNDIFLDDPEHRMIEPNIDRITGITVENESRFEYEWYESKLFERPREKFYIVAYPASKDIVPFHAGETLSDIKS